MIKLIFFNTTSDFVRSLIIIDALRYLLLKTNRTQKLRAHSLCMSMFDEGL